MRNTSFVLIVLLFTAVSFILLYDTAIAQIFGEIRGQVKDAATGEALPGANVLLQGTVLGSSTDLNGMFAIKRVPPGIYTLRVSFIGYQIARATIQVRVDSVMHQNFALEPSTLEIAEVVVTASRQPEEIQTAVVSVSALTTTEALRRNPLRLDAALESIPGVNLMGENVNVRNSTGYTRGLGNRVLILLDGVPMLTSDLGNMNWDILPVTDFERVEVIKGPSSALYGSFALGGVINIITKAPQPEGRFSVRMSAGIYDKPYESVWHWTDRTLNFNRTDLSYSKQIGKLGVRLSFGRHESTGDRQNRHFQRWNGTSKLTWTFNDASELSLFAAYARDRRGEFVEARRDNPYLVPLEFLPYRLALDAYTFYLQYRRQLNDWLEMKWRASYVRQLTGNQYKKAGDFQPAQGPGADWQIHAQLDSSMSFTVGLEYHYDFAEQRHFGRHFAYTISPYLQQIWEPHRNLRFTLGLRYDHYYLLPGPKEQTQFGNLLVPVQNPLPEGKEEQYVTPQIGASYQLFPATVIHAAVGQGIRIPALGERFLQFDQPIRFEPNAKISTERSYSIEFGMRQRFGSYANLEVTAFSNSYRDLIEPVFVADATSFYATLVNIPHARIQGVETAGRVQYWQNRIGLEATATWTDPVITEVSGTSTAPIKFKKGDLLSYRPRLIAYLSPSLNFGPLSLQADYGFASKLAREQVQLYKDDQRVPKKQLDMRLLYRWQGLTAQFAVRNLLQYTYTQVERNANEVRNFAVGMMWEN
ncbi:MAG: TonB-dependent receptor [candidate division KSB1 bacterium]|nr:TonB-dependent receptor [candidate division KSB1 bacterium]MDZ7313403.1 TonB-dependent receptor [candidate division KSB1 bacterium]